MLNTRSVETELIDLGAEHYSLEEYEDCLIKLDRIGRWLGGDRASFSALDKLDLKFASILDVGCGGGLFTTRLAMRYPHVKVVGLDINSQAIDFAKKQLSMMQKPPKNLIFECPTQKKLDENVRYDIIISTLVCHHMSDQELIDFISSAKRIAKKKVILNDLHRHPMAQFLFKMISPIFFKNRLVQHDGLVSIRRSFKYHEWVHYLESSGLNPSQYDIQWKFAFRWLIQINGEILYD